jgi:hypothetical protein
MIARYRRCINVCLGGLDVDTQIPITPMTASAQKSILRTTDQDAFSGLCSLTG